MHKRTVSKFVEINKKKACIDVKIEKKIKKEGFHRCNDNENIIDLCLQLCVIADRSAS